MDKQVIIDFIKQCGWAEVPSLQCQFNLSYKQARDFVSELVSKQCLAYDKGVTYVCIGKFLEKTPPASNGQERENVGKTPEERDRAMAEFLRKAEERRLKRMQLIMEKQQRQQQQKIDAEKLEKEALAWLKEKLKNNNSFMLLDAKVQSEQELIDAKNGDNQELIQARERVYDYFSSCSEFGFALLKLDAFS